MSLTPGHNDAAQKPRRELDRATQIRLADVATSFYVDGRSKIQIAEQLSVSRFAVAKMLDEALEFGIVSITIRDPRNPASVLDSRVAALLGIAQVRVVDISADPSKHFEKLGMAVMDEFRDRVRPHTTVGISWSRSLDFAARFLPDLPSCDIIQLAGALEVYGTSFLPRIVAQQGENSGIRTFPISAPLVVDEKSTARDLMRQPGIAEALTRADSMDLAIIAIGAWRSGQSTVWEKVSEADRRAGSAGGAVAEVSGRLIDANGVAVQTDLDERTISVRVDQLIRTPQVIGIAHGIERVDAVIASARAGIVTCLVVDSELALAIVAQLDPVRDLS